MSHLATALEPQSAICLPDDLRSGVLCARSYLLYGDHLVAHGREELVLRDGLDRSSSSWTHVRHHPHNLPHPDAHLREDGGDKDGTNIRTVTQALSGPSMRASGSCPERAADCEWRDDGEKYHATTACVRGLERAGIGSVATSNISLESR